MNGVAKLGRMERERLRRQLEKTKDARVFRRTFAVLESDRGKPAAHIAEALGVDRRSVSRWIAAYRETHDVAILSDADRPGRPPLWTEECSNLLEDIMETSPEDLGYVAVNWTVPLLQEHLDQVMGHRFSDETIRRRLEQLNFVWKRERYVLDPDPEREKKKTDRSTNSAFGAP